MMINEQYRRWKSSKNGQQFLLLFVRNGVAENEEIEFDDLRKRDRSGYGGRCSHVIALPMKQHAARSQELLVIRDGEDALGHLGQPFFLMESTAMIGQACVARQTPRCAALPCRVRESY